MASKLTRAARGQDCTVQLYPYCNENPETVVFAHAPSEDSGWSRKSPDWWGADCCSACHDVVDGRRQTEISSEEVSECFTRGVFRTIQRRIDAGLINVV